MNTLLQGDFFWDGAITGQNNPIVAGVIEALANGAVRENIVVLSLGTGTNTIPPALVANPPWQMGSDFDRGKADLRKLAAAVIGDPPDHASFVAHMMLTNALPPSGAPRPSHNSPIVRMNPMIAPMPNSNPGAGTWTWPAGLATPEQRKIIDLDMAAVNKDDFVRVQNLASAWINGDVRNQPIRMGGDLACDIGDDKFDEASDRWNAIR